MNNICVYCGSQMGSRQEYGDAARELGVEMVKRGYGLVFGGGHIGLMGVIADAVMGAGGTVIGVIPQALVDRELAHRNITELHVVESMHDRKAMMAMLSDGFAALPGGFGTMEEIFEAVTWTQLGIHRKPCAFLNVDGYFDPLRTMLDRFIDEGFIRSAYRSLLVEAETPASLLDIMERWEGPKVRRWISGREM